MLYLVGHNWAGGAEGQPDKEPSGKADSRPSIVKLLIPSDLPVASLRFALTSLLTRLRAVAFAEFVDRGYILRPVALGMCHKN